MNLAFCLFNYFPFGGLERNFMAISQECSRRGHTIDVYTMHWEGPHTQVLNINIVPIRGFSNHSKAAAFSKYLHSNLHRSQYDLIMGFNKIPGIDLYYAADVCYTARIKNQRNFLSKLTPRYHVFSGLERSVFDPESSTHIVYLSKREKQIYQEMYGTQEKRFHYAPPGIHKDKIRSFITKENRKEIRNFLKLKEEDNFLLMIGSNFQTKGVDRSIKALASLPPTLLGSTYLFIIGKGKEEKYKKLAITLGIGENVHFLGGRDDVPIFLAGADFLLQPSLNENTGNAIIEALVASVPVLATENCGYSDHIAIAKAGKIIPGFPFKQEKMNTLLHEMIEFPDRKLWKENALKYTDKTDLYSRHTIIADLIETIGSAQKQTNMSQNHYSDPIGIDLLADSTCQHFVTNRAFKTFLTRSKLTTFDAIWSFPKGKLVKKKGQRSVLCVHFAGNVFYLKKHTERLNPLTRLIHFFQSVKSISEGLKEFYNYCEFRSKGLGTAIPVAAGMRYTSWLTIESFLITQDFTPLIDLEEIVLNQPELLQGDINLVRKHNILQAIGQYARKMHHSGVNHKDFNATHLLLNDIDTKNTQVALFDLQRVDKMILNRFRWPIKSLAELFYTLPINIFSENDRCFLFKKYKDTEILSWLDKMQYQWILKKMARIARHCRKRNLSPKMKED